MDNEYTPQSHRILYPGLNGIRTYAVPPRVVTGRVRVPPSATVRPRLCGPLTLTTTFAMVAVKRPVAYEPLKCPLGLIAND